MFVACHIVLFQKASTSGEGSGEQKRETTDAGDEDQDVIDKYGLDDYDDDDDTEQDDDDDGR